MHLFQGVDHFRGMFLRDTIIGLVKNVKQFIYLMKGPGDLELCKVAWGGLI